MRYLSVCSGIEAASVAWKSLQWEAIAFSEIDAFACAVLTHRFPNTPLFGDFTKIGNQDVGTVELLVGGTPCQDFSIAGLRAGLDGKRGQLTIEFIRLLKRIRPLWMVWENVPGILSSDDGRAFGIFLGALGECGYGFAYRILDAQYFGVPQRRRRVFVIGYLGDWRPPAAVLFERESLRGDPSSSANTGADIAHCVTSRFGSGRNDPTAESYITAPLTGNPYADRASEESLLVTHTLRGEGFDASEDGTGRGTPLVPIAFALRGRENGAMPEMHGAGQAIGALRAANGGSSRDMIAGKSVRRLTPRECERLQGFPDDWTLVPYRGKAASDGPRYRALGNSMAVPIMQWLGNRITLTHTLKNCMKDA